MSKPRSRAWRGRAFPERNAGRVPSACALVCVIGCVAGRASAQLSLEYSATALLPGSAIDQHGEAFTITGLSGVTRLGGDSYAAVMDRGGRLVLFELALGSDGSIGGVSGVRGLTLARTGDHEGIASAAPGVVMVSNEGASTIREFSLVDGSLLRTLALPEIYSTRRNNLGMESFTFDLEFAWTANEEALTPDGPRSTPDHGTLVRLLRLRTSTSHALSQHVYPVEPMHGPIFPFGNPGQSGLSDLVTLPNGGLLALERSLALADPPFLTRIYEVHAEIADDVSHLAALEGAEFTPVAKTLLYEGGHNNLEGLCLGPRLTRLAHAVVGVVDDGDPISANSLVVFRLGGLDACPFDVDGDGAIDIDDLHRLHETPLDLDGDGSADEDDRACLEAYLRRHEGFDTRFGSGR